MKIDSTRLLQMIEGSAESPLTKLLCVYACLEAWLNSPGVRENIIDLAPEITLVDACPELLPYLKTLASRAKMESPIIYAEQTLILLQGAMAEELRNPGSGAFLKARDAAKCIMHACKTPPLRARFLPMQNVLIPAGMLCLMVVFLTPVPDLPSSSHQPQMAPAWAGPEYRPTMSPELMGRTIALKEKFDTGSCPAPQLINMPPDRVNGYINVVNANFSDRSAFESERLNAFLNWYDNYMARECKAENNQKIVLGMAK